MKKNKGFAAAVLTLICTAFIAAAAFAGDANWEPGQVDASALLDERQTSVWVEGSLLGDMVIGARGALQIIYVDNKLARAITADFSIHDWAKSMAQYYGSDATRGKALFIAHVETYKPWSFDPSKVFVGGYHLTEDDVLSPSMTNPFGELGSDQTGFFAFVVPASELKKGEEIQIGYGDDSALWKVLK